ncbi:hypothetical protein D2V04_02670 [Pelagerythrobacter aerophilus]|uniref:Uncharacterized protein n=1 Tax=Pelagerythrobacter aerophilus TaxID=2306995 RepID=A0A418NL87_9SPHN|nr:hypothetical protein D2V04_02670 [Pelagerythrobacter aerophilus]
MGADGGHVPRIWRYAPEGAALRVFGAPHALANRQRVGRAGSYGRDRPRLPCFPQALGHCLSRRCGSLL